VLVLATRLAIYYILTCDSVTVFLALPTLPRSSHTLASAGTVATRVAIYYILTCDCVTMASAGIVATRVAIYYILTCDSVTVFLALFTAIVLHESMNTETLT
jgi:hypothetical protein